MTLERAEKLGLVSAPSPEARGDFWSEGVPRKAGGSFSWGSEPVLGFGWIPVERKAIGKNRHVFVFFSFHVFLGHEHRHSLPIPAYRAGKLVSPENNWLCNQ